MTWVVSLGVSAEGVVVTDSASFGRGAVVVVTGCAVVLESGETAGVSVGEGDGEGDGLEEAAFKLSIWTRRDCISVTVPAARLVTSKIDC